MINVKKGPAHSLGQADVRGVAPAAGGITSGMVCYVDGTDTPGLITKGGIPVTKTGILGFAINDSGDHDVLESGKIALYTLDGASVIETDQTAETLNTTNYPIGKPVFAELTTGKVTNVATSHAGPIGWVEGIRDLQADGNVTLASQNYTSIYTTAGVVDGTAQSTKAIVPKVQKNIPVLSIKLASFSTAKTA